VRYYIREYEKQWIYIYPSCSAKANKNIEAGFTIVDLDKATVSILKPKQIAFVEIASDICQNYYPETLGL